MKIFLTFTLFCFSSIQLFSQTTDTLKIKNIQEVIIKGQKKSVLQTDKGILLNVAGSPLEQKENVNDILKFAPNVSQTNGLSILGSDKIQIILNNKEVKIKPEQFNTFFSSLDAKSIKSIEIVDKPDASLESKYTSQIIINTKAVEGYVANLGMGLNYNNYFGNSSDASFIATFGKLRLYTSGSFFQKYKNEAEGNSIMIFNDGFRRTGITDATVNRLRYNGTLNLDYDFNKKNQLSFLYDYTVDEDLDKVYTYKYKISSPTISDSTAVVRNSSETKNKTHTFSLQYLYLPDEFGSKLTINADYALEKFLAPFSTESQFYSNQILEGTEDKFQNSRLTYNIFTTSADYKKVFKNKSDLTFGIKYANSGNQNILDYYNFSVFSPVQSQHFDFYENIYSAFIRYTFKKGKFKYNFGLRNEYTDNDFVTNKNLSGSKDYNSFLPSATVSYTINENNSVYLYASKSISRPSFFSYDPTVSDSQPNQFYSGNQDLKPVDIYRLQAGYTLKQRYRFILQYLYTKNNIVDIPSTIDDNILFTKVENAGYQNSVLLSLSIPVKFTKFWESTNKINLFYRDFRISKLDYFMKGYSATIESTQSFSLPHKIGIDLDLSYNAPNKSQYYYNYSNFRSSVSMVVPVFKGNGNIRFSLSDIFNTDLNKSRSDINGIYQYYRLKFTTRGFSLKFSYNFKSGKEFNEDTRSNNIDDLLNRTGK